MGRLDGPGVIHYEKYHKLTSDELDDITKKYDNEDLHIGLNYTWKKTHNHYLDWLFKEWLNQESLTTKSQAFTLLKRSGFVDSE